MDRGTCQSCGAEIVWVVMASGKRMPLDAKPQKRIVVSGENGDVVDAYISHFATCPNAGQHRKK